MFKLTVLFALLLLGACATPVEEPKPSLETTKFLADWKEVNEDLDAKYLATYEKYLHTVEALYRKSNHESEFKNYLSSITNNAQILSHKENILPIVYRKQNHTVRRAMSFELYRTKELANLRDKIYAERELRIQERLGNAFFLELRNNYMVFMTQENAGSYAFPL